MNDFVLPDIFEQCHFGKVVTEMVAGRQHNLLQSYQTAELHTEGSFMNTHEKIRKSPENRVEFKRKEQTEIQPHFVAGMSITPFR